MTEGSNDRPPGFSLDFNIGKEMDRTLAELLGLLFRPSTAEIGSFFGNALGLVSDRMHRKRLLNTELGMIEVRKKTEAANIESDKIKGPKEEELHLLINGMSLTDDASVRDLWAGLFARALDPNSKGQIERAFIAVLATLSPADARIIDFLAFLARTENELNNLPRVPLRDSAVISKEEADKLEEARLNNLNFRRQSLEAILDKAASYGLDRVGGGGWADNLMRQGVIRRTRIITQAAPDLDLHSMDERGLLQAIVHFNARIGTLDQLAEREAIPPDALFTHDRMTSQIRLEVEFTDFGKKLSHACGLQ